jgi:hypothetical protein
MGGFASVMQPINAACRGQPAATPAHDSYSFRAGTTFNWRSQTRTRDDTRTLENYFREFSFFSDIETVIEFFTASPPMGPLPVKPAELLLFHIGADSSLDGSSEREAARQATLDSYRASKVPSSTRRNLECPERSCPCENFAKFFDCDSS